MNETYINSESCCKLLMKIAALNLSVPITLVLDNARYQKCKLVQDFANSVGIEFLSSISDETTAPEAALFMPNVLVFRIIILSPYTTMLEY